MQVQNVVKLYTYNGPRDAMKKIHNTEGLIGLYRVNIEIYRLLEQLYSFSAHGVPSSLPAMKN